MYPHSALPVPSTVMGPVCPRRQWRRAPARARLEAPTRRLSSATASAGVVSCAPSRGPLTVSARRRDRRERHSTSRKEARTA